MGNYDGRLEDVTPERMRALNEEMERKAVENGAFNGKNLVNTYRCGMCGNAMVTVDLHVGVTPFTVACDRGECSGTAVSSMYRPRKRSDETVVVDYEWFRPLIEKECRAFREEVQSHVSEVDLSDYPLEERMLYREAMRNEQAEHILRGGLHRRKAAGVAPGHPYDCQVTATPTEKG